MMIVDSSAGWSRARRAGSAVLGLVTLAAPLLAGGPPLNVASEVIELDRQIDWSRARLIAVQDANRYKTLDSFARESLHDLTGGEHLPGLSPLGSLLELLFDRAAYEDRPIIYIRDKGLRIHFTDRLPEARRVRVRRSGYMTPRELSDPLVARRIDELEPRFDMGRAISRVRNAEALANMLNALVRIVPPPVADATAAWYAPRDLRANLPAEVLQESGAREVGRPVAGVSPARALAVIVPWASLRAAWLGRDAAGVQSALDRLAEVLPTLAEPGVYPAASQRAAEARYYALGKFTGGWVLYFLGFLVAVWALVTRWRVPWGLALLLLVAALGWHAYGLSLRWYILGRVPVANMFEALVASAWLGIAAALLVELWYRTRFLLVAAHATGFLALLLAGYVIPGGGTLTSIMGILDDVMLRIHTVMIIAAYALIFLAAVIALIYLFGYYHHVQPRLSARVGLLLALAGTVLLLAALLLFAPGAAGAVVKRGFVAPASWAATVAALLALTVLAWRRAPGAALVGAATALTVCATLTVGNRDFTMGVAAVLLLGGLLWAASNVMGLALRARPTVLAPDGATAGTGMQRPVLAGGMPGDEGLGAKLPKWLHHCDWSHLIILNLVFILLFVGTILGAVWADYSWGRPWGWDPKEVFALNTWLVYAILIHVRFVVRRRGLWTAWLSLAGCLMMAFNWCFVNFYIVGLHSYA